MSESKVDNLYEFDEKFRDSIGTVDEQGKRVWVYPKKPKGRFHNARAIVAVVLLTLLFATPFIQVDGHPWFLFNIFERKFILFGVAFWPQDFHLFVLASLAFIVFIVLFTVVFGRVWCGWACPQTIFMEMVFRKIEYWIEGDAIKQRKLNARKWDADKIWRKGLKLTIFLFISVLIGHTLMAYLIGIEQVKTIVTQSPTHNMAGFTGLVVFSGIFFFIFTWFREQACIAVCPYGRLQGVFVGKDTLAVMYDWLRGEPRGKIKKGADLQGQGDCIDCKLCVHACPTGIDIRNGTQLECVNCTACIDACDEVMEKVGRPKGLIRVDSVKGVGEGRKSIFTTRVFGYSAILLVILGILTSLLLTRSDIETTILRVPGMLYQEQDNGNISNLYNVQFVNKTFEAASVNLKIQNNERWQGTIRQIGGEGITIDSAATAKGTFFIELPPEKLENMKTKLVIEVYKDGEVVDEVKTNFLGPA